MSRPASCASSRAASERGHQTVLTVERERDLGDQHEVRRVVGECGVRGNEPGGEKAAERALALLALIREKALDSV